MSVRSLVGVWRWVLCCLVASIAVCATSARAQTTVDLSLSDAIVQAADSAPVVLAAVARLEVARSEIDVAGMFPDPRLTVGATTGSSTVYTQLYINAPIFGQRETAQDAAAALARVAEAGVEVTRLDAMLAVALAWMDVFGAAGEAHSARETLTRRERLLAAVQTRFEEGAAPRLDVLRTRPDVERARAEVDALDEMARAAGSRIAVLLGRDPTRVVIVPAGEPSAATSVPALSEIDSVLAVHPIGAWALASVVAADAAVTRDHRARWPLVGIQIAANLAERFGPPYEDFQVQLQFQLPIFDEPLITRSERTRDAVSVERQAALDQLRARIVGARADYLAADRRYRVLAEQVVPDATEAGELALEAYASGRLDLTGALFAEQTLADVRLELVRLTANRGRARAALDHALGRLQ